MKILGMGLAAALLAAGAATAGEVVVEVSGVQARGGTLYAALQRRDEFMNYAATAHSAKVDAPRAGVLRLTIPNVAPGEYALAVLHDFDGDRRMDMAENFMPLEGWAMSRGENLQTQPTFDDVKVAVPAAGATVRASMIYYDGKVPAR